MITISGLTKRYGAKTAVDDITCTIEPGRVTGFLGPNGAGKSTTMRMVVGLDRPSAGTVTVNGKRYADHRAPLHEVGVLLDAKAVHTGRTAYHHLLAMAATHGIGAKRVREVIAWHRGDGIVIDVAGRFPEQVAVRSADQHRLLPDTDVRFDQDPVQPRLDHRDLGPGSGIAPLGVGRPALANRRHVLALVLADQARDRRMLAILMFDTARDADPDSHLPRLSLRSS